MINVLFGFAACEARTRMLTSHQRQAPWTKWKGTASKKVVKSRKCCKITHWAISGVIGQTANLIEIGSFLHWRRNQPLTGRRIGCNRLCGFHFWVREVTCRIPFEFFGVFAHIFGLIFEYKLEYCLYCWRSSQRAPCSWSRRQLVLACRTALEALNLWWEMIRDDLIRDHTWLTQGLTVQFTDIHRDRDLKPPISACVYQQFLRAGFWQCWACDLPFEEAKESLQRACVRFDELELDRLASSISTAVAEQLESYNRRVPLNHVADCGTNPFPCSSRQRNPVTVYSKLLATGSYATAFVVRDLCWHGKLTALICLVCSQLGPNHCSGLQVCPFFSLVALCCLRISLQRALDGCSRHCFCFHLLC